MNCYCYNAARSAGLYGNIIGPGLQSSSRQQPIDQQKTAAVAVHPQQLHHTHHFAAYSSEHGRVLHVVPDKAGVVHWRQWEQPQGNVVSYVVMNNDI